MPADSSHAHVSLYPGGESDIMSATSIPPRKPVIMFPIPDCVWAAASGATDGKGGMCGTEVIGVAVTIGYGWAERDVHVHHIANRNIPTANSTIVSIASHWSW